MSAKHSPHPIRLIILSPVSNILAVSPIGVCFSNIMALWVLEEIFQFDYIKKAIGMGGDIAAWHIPEEGISPHCHFVPIQFNPPPNPLLAFPPPSLLPSMTPFLTFSFFQCNYRSVRSVPFPPFYPWLCPSSCPFFIPVLALGQTSPFCHPVSFTFASSPPFPFFTAPTERKISMNGPWDGRRHFLRSARIFMLPSPQFFLPY